MDKLKLKPYCTGLVHDLFDDDPDRWLKFCESICAHIVNEQPDLLDKIIWSDEACFKLSGHVNRHNYMYWANKNPHLIIESQLNQNGVTTWGTLSSKGVIGPVMNDGTVTGDNYWER